MSSSSPIGGYFELELRSGGFLHDDAILLNSGRNCFAYVLQAAKPRRVYIPKFTCDTMIEPLEQQGVSYSFYAVNERLEVAEKIDVADNELLVYTNYFGVKDDYSRYLSQVYKNRLVLDSSQAWYLEPLKVGHTFYSPRKFFGVADGGCLVSLLPPPQELPLDTSHQRMSHLLKRIDLGPEAAYDDFKRNDTALSGEPIKQMSRLTQRLLGSVDHEAVLHRRKQNFAYLHRALSAKNKLKIDELASPLCYPLLTDDPDLRKMLIDCRIFVPTYWPNVLEWCKPDEPEYRLAQQVLPLPIDQRYDETDMERILEVLA